METSALTASNNVGQTLRLERHLNCKFSEFKIISGRGERELERRFKLTHTYGASCIMYF